MEFHSEYLFLEDAVSVLSIEELNHTLQVRLIHSDLIQTKMFRFVKNIRRDCYKNGT